MSKFLSLVIGLIMVLSFVIPVAAASPSQMTDDAGRHYFSETGYYVSDLPHGFLSYWEKNGGLPVFGYPISGEIQETNPDTGQTLTVQYFERARFEYHPENAGTPYAVELGRFGDEVLRQLYGNVDTIEAWHPDTGAGEFFDTTGHNVQGFPADGLDTESIFYSYWHNHGLDLGDSGISFRESLALFGYPISDVFDEEQPDGSIYQVQYFERARFEYHPELRGTSYVVLLGLFGHSVLTPPAPSNCLPAMQISQGKVLVPLGAGGTTMFLRDSRIGTDSANNLFAAYVTSAAQGIVFQGNLRITFLEFPAGCETVGNALVHNAKVQPIINPDYHVIIGPFSSTN